ncbi:unnamed protein product [Owenia fusiformis]|uniref:SRCR domain-containing protein n=1 Tax=Owenia fusiformis TaxID=6347 RepID=A0A8S4NWD7_OWEFU|nr:unnamed protein product [Owenia fusiformis]
MEYCKRVLIFIFHLVFLSFKTFGQTPALNATVRLVKGTESAGIVEVLGPHGWGTLCQRAIDTNADVAVVCKQLGFKDAIAIPISPLIFEPYDQYPKFVIRDVDCKGDEDSIQDCKNTGWEDSDIFVTSFLSIPSAVWCAEKEPRLWLSGGRGEFEGNVEVDVQIEGFAGWGYMCNPEESDLHGYDLKRLTKAAQVICVQQGFKREDAYPLFGDYFEMAESTSYWTLPFLISRFDCQGTEASLFDCKFKDGDPECKHKHAFAVSCKRDPIKYRLVGGQRESHGRLEVYGFGYWSPVCQYNFQNEAAVVCKSLGYKSNKTKPTDLPSYMFFGTSSERIRLTGVNCKGDEKSLALCQRFILGRLPIKLLDDLREECGYKDQIGIDCEPEPVQVRLVDGPNNRSGRVEIYYSGTWGTVCGRHFDEIDAKIVCNTLGFGKNAKFIRHVNSDFGKGHLEQIMELSGRCSEKKLKFERCQDIGWGDWCWNHGVAGITCGTKKDCIYGGVLYSHHQQMPSIDKCQKCKCKHGQKVCEAKMTKKCRELE